jgi:3-dehydroquinate synthase
VVVDIDLLDTLPDREFRSGLAEVVKYGLIKDPRLFEWLEANLERVLQRDPSAVLEVVRRSCEIKAAIVKADEREGPSGIRAILNLGHTFGHAIEAGLGYGALLHGEAVAVGLVLASQLSAALGWVPPARVDRVSALLGRAHLPVSLKGACELIGGHRRISSDTFLDLMSR